MQVGATVTQMAEMIHAHPTLSEGMMEAAEDVDAKAIHQTRRKEVLKSSSHQVVKSSDF
jgi:dihydrolipoamide dehydrogenase